MRPTIAAVLIFASFQSLDCLTGSTNSRLNYFDIDLLRYVAEGESGNVMVSPASMKSMLAMLLEGARGTTAAEIKTALRLRPDKEDYREQLSGFIRDLEVNTSGVSVQNANGLFVSKKLHLRKDYETMARRAYLSEVNSLDFSDPRTAAETINGWISRKTKNLIPTIVDLAHINPQTEFLVTNALYFKGTWLNKFESRQSHGDCFYTKGNCRTVSMMDLEAELNYAYVDNLRAHALELPYEGNRYSMILLVPQDRDSGVALIRDLPYIGLLQISQLMEPNDVLLTMPKFTVEYSGDMVQAMKSMRINTLFSTSANLSGILEDSTGHVNSIFHKVYMSVDEKGTTASAASAGMVVPLINNFVQLKIDRPFLFFIWDNQKGVVLFEGKIEEPTELVAGQATVKPPNPHTQFTDQRIYPQLPPVQQPYPQPIPIQQSVQPIVGQPFNGQPYDQTPAQPPLQPYPSYQPTNYPTTTSTSLPVYTEKEQSIFKKLSSYFG